MTESTEKLVKKYLVCKKLLKLKERYFDFFEYRYGITDGKFHTQRETGQKFGISANRIGQLEARVKYELEKLKN